MQHLPDLYRLIGDLMRIGTVASVDLADATCTVRVGDLVTGDVPWLALRAGGTRHWSPVTEGEQVLLLCPEGDTANGLVLAGLFSNAAPAPSSAEKLDLIHYADGAQISYDAAGHKLVATLPDGATADLTAPGGLTVTAKGGITLDAEGGVTIKGDVDLTGKLTASEDVVADGTSLKSHVHAGVQAGGAKTQGPQ